MCPFNLLCHVGGGGSGGRGSTVTYRKLRNIKPGKTAGKINIEDGVEITLKITRWNTTKDRRLQSVLKIAAGSP